MLDLIKLYFYFYWPTLLLIIPIPFIIGWFIKTLWDANQKPTNPEQEQNEEEP